jgi:hypothetical protein
LSQTPKPLHEPASSRMFRLVWNQPHSSVAFAGEQIVFLQREALQEYPTAFAVPAVSCRCPSAHHESR